MAAGITDVLEDIAQQAHEDRLSAGDIVSAFEHRGFGPLLLAPGLLALLPTGAVPGVPTVVGLLIVLVAGQMVVGRDSPWIPQRLRNASIQASTYQRIYAKVAPVTRGIDKVLRPRLRVLVRPPAPRLIAIVCVVLALSMAPLELIPFMGAVPALVISLLALGLTAEDGLVVALGLGILLLGVVGGPAWWL
ncbi:MAG: exopolysaccharide biosynthesis protein [Halofilum sp. (in: g-proteobacteria)]